jgi:Mg2+ and Co2+ transporter CorA
MRPDYDWTLPQKITARLGQSSYGRQRAIFEDETCLLILHTPPERKNHKRETLVFLRQPGGQWKCNGRDDGIMRLQKLLLTYEDQCDKFLDEFQKAETSDLLFELLTRLNSAKRTANDMFTALQAARDLIKVDPDLIECRDRAYEISRNYELIYHDAKTALDFRIAKNSQDDAEAAKLVLKAQHKLNVLAAIFFPLMALTSIFGMNLPNGLEKLGIPIFWVIFICGLVIGTYFKGWVIEKSNRPAHKN